MEIFQKSTCLTRSRDCNIAPTLTLLSSYYFGFQFSGGGSLHVRVWNGETDKHVTLPCIKKAMPYNVLLPDIFLPLFKQKLKQYSGVILRATRICLLSQKFPRLSQDLDLSSD